MSSKLLWGTIWRLLEKIMVKRNKEKLYEKLRDFYMVHNIRPWWPRYLPLYHDVNDETGNKLLYFNIPFCVVLAVCRFFEFHTP
jgi:hypothetical protein